MPRHDFPRTIIRTLGQRAAQRCSNPECRTLTCGPHTASSKAVNVGVAAHILAAAAGGPRFEASLTPEQRRSADNGIWLCQKCARLIDSDPLRYSTALLHRWKAEAELAARREIETGSSQPTPPHSIDFAVNDWQLWRERGNLPGDRLVVVSIWGRGDIRYSCVVRLRNRLDMEEQLHSVRVQWRRGEEVLFADEYAHQHDIRLPPRQWVKIDVSYGIHLEKIKVFDGSDSVWLSALSAGDDCPMAWKLADISASQTPCGL